MHLPGIGSFEQYVSACVSLRQDGRSLLDSEYLKGLAIGFYADYVGDWFEAFPNDVRVIFFEDLASDPAAVIADLCRWLVIDDAVTGSLDYTAQNKTVHPRSIRLGRAAYAIKERFRGVLDRAPGLRRALRAAYLGLNRGDAPETLQPETRERVQAIYRESNATIARLLRSRGYDRLPAWLPKD